MKIAAIMMATAVSGKLIPLPQGCPVQSEPSEAYMYKSYDSTSKCEKAIV